MPASGEASMTRSWAEVVVMPWQPERASEASSRAALRARRLRGRAGVRRGAGVPEWEGCAMGGWKDRVQPQLYRIAGCSVARRGVKRARVSKGELL